ncbi:uncharacterized protein [Parasteatoda tepidariorum]|uniref:uncharacterized protein n=1 Tax=Parasteatoda tepidariorum TaxID=114398 RepID=UPI00077F9D2F|nr:uncharacterized protein LOC107455603 [Parasteatoda tepidariorum]
MAESRHLWTHAETIALIDVWEQRYEQLRSQRRTAHVHEEMQAALCAINIEKTIRQIVVKIDNLTQKYRKTKSSGKHNPTWIYFKRLDSFIDRRHSRRHETNNNYDDQVTNDITKIDEASAVSGAGMGQYPSISIANFQGHDWRNACAAIDLSTKMNRNAAYEEELAGYRLELLSVISSLVEIQRHSLAVQEKIITLATRMANSFYDSHSNVKCEADHQ